MPEPVVPPADSELRAYVERALGQHYELGDEIGRGGMGIVYRARDRRLKRTVAIKVLPPELAFRSEIKTRFLREAETAAQLNHPNIVPIYTVDEAQGLVFFEMAFVSGENLAKRLHDRGVLPVNEVRRLLRDVADALAYAHERGVVHRDIKPDNILLDAETGRPMVTDFGIARAVSDSDSRLTATGMAIGTPAYMSPEQAAGERTIDGRSDIYALGIVAYQMLAGEPPFSAASTPAMLVKHISERPTPIEQRRADMPPDLARAVMVMLEKDPANRFATAGDLVAALDGVSMPIMVAPPPAGVASVRVAADEPAGRAGGIAAGAHPSIFDSAVYVPTAADVGRWEAPKVQAFRSKVRPYLLVNGVIVVASILTDTSFTWLTVMWSIYMAFKYARLWSDGYDWRDVFKQPRDRELMEVFDDTMQHVRALFDGKKRQALAEARRQRRIARRSSGGLAAVAGVAAAPRLSDGTLAQATGSHAAAVQQAAMDRDEIIRLVESLPAADRARVPDVGRSAIALHDKVQGLAISLADLERSGMPGGVEAFEAEIVRLESAANPLDLRASEERVRRLAFLKRQRRAIADGERRRKAVAARLESCAIMLRNMKLDVLRLRSGTQTHQNITSLAMSALSLAESVDSAVFAADELRRGGTGLGDPRPSAGQR